MFYDVRVYTPKKNLKKVIPSEQLSKIHWEVFEKNKIIRKKLKSLLPRIKPGKLKILPTIFDHPKGEIKCLKEKF